MLIALICSIVIAVVCTVDAQTKLDAQSLGEKKRLKEFLQSLDGSKDTRYVAAFVDLNSDATTEAVVYLIGSEWCGSGGCNTLILERRDNSWNIVTSITITRPPISILVNRFHGWNSIGVWVEGGGVYPGYQAELRFDGKTYPRNPSTPPARRLKGGRTGEVVISSVKDAASLYEPE
jgi:hypothetical protein